MTRIYNNRPNKMGDSLNPTSHVYELYNLSKFIERSSTANAIIFVT